jgi:hypothetical protein
MALPVEEPLDAAFEVALPAAPYPGLRPFEPQEWPTFFGRERMTDEVVGRVIRQHLVVVHGDSGCGKSSLVRAGVLAQLKQERARSGVRWRTALMLPREAPLRRLAVALVGLRGATGDPDQLHQMRRILNRGADAPAALAELLRGGNDDHFCILIDQFEELFAFARRHGRDEAQLFVDILVGLQQNPPPSLYAILTMRSEFLCHCARFTGLAEAVNRTQYLLPQMERPALLRAICEPALLYGGEVSRALAERLIIDAGGDQDQLPLIQHGLMLLSRRKRLSTGLDADPGPYPYGGLAEAPARYEIDEAPGSFRHNASPAWRLDLDDYQGAGDLATLLSDHADRVMAIAAPDPHRQKIVEHLFRALTDINAEGNAIRRPQTLAQLVTVTGSDEQTLGNIIDHFREEGVSFLRPYRNQPIEPDNEIDISHEALIRGWQKIADPKDGWLQQEFEDGLTWNTLRMQAQKGEMLSAAATADPDQWLRTLPSSDWCQRYGGGWGDIQGLMDRSRKARDRELRQRRALEEAKRREAEERARRAEEAEQAAAKLAEAHERIAEEQRQRAEAEQQRAAEAETRGREADAGRRRFKRTALVVCGLWLLVLLVALAAAGIWWQASRARAEAQYDESLYRSEQARKALRDGSPITAMQLALVGLPDSPETLGARPWVSETAGALVEAMGAQRELKDLRGHEGAVWAAGFSPDGARIVSGSYDQTVRVWDAASGKQLLVLRGHEGPVWAAGFSPDGARIVSGSDDKTVRVWDAASGKELLVLRGHEGPVYAVGFSPDGTRIVSGSWDQTVRVWPARNKRELIETARARLPRELTEAEKRHFHVTAE